MLKSPVIKVYLLINILIQIVMCMYMLSVKHTSVKIIGIPLFMSFQQWHPYLVIMILIWMIAFTYVAKRTINELIPYKKINH